MANIVNTPITMYVKEHTLELYGDSITELMEYNSYPVKIYSDEELEGCHLVKRHQNSQKLVSVGQLKKDVRRLYRSVENDSDDPEKRAWWVFLENLNEQDAQGKPLNIYGGVLKTYNYEKIPTVISDIDRISNYNVIESDIIKGTFNEDFSEFTVVEEFQDKIPNLGVLKTDFLDIPLPLNEQTEIKIPEVLTIEDIKLDISNSILASIQTELSLGELKLENISYDEEEGYYYYYQNTELSKQIETLIKVRMEIAFYNNGNLYEDSGYKKLKEIEDNIFYYDFTNETIYKKKATLSLEETEIVEEVALEDNQEIIEEKEDEENSSFYIQTKQEITVNCSIQATCKVSENNFNDYFINIDLFLSSLLGEEIFTYSYDETDNLTLDWGTIKFEERPFDLTEVLLNETSDDYSNVYTLYSLEETSEPIEFYSDRYNGAGLNELLLGIRKQVSGKTEYVTNSVSLIVIPSIESDSWFVPVYNIKRGYLGKLETEQGVDDENNPVDIPTGNFVDLQNNYYPQEVDAIYIEIIDSSNLKIYAWDANSTGFKEITTTFLTSSLSVETEESENPEIDGNEENNANGQPTENMEL